MTGAATAAAVVTPGDVPEGAPKPGVWEFFVVASSVMAAEVGLIWLWAEGGAVLGFQKGALPGGVWAYLAGHAVLSAGLVWWTRNRRHRDLDQRFAGLLAVTTTFLGPTGPFCTLMCAMAHGVFKRYATGFHDWYLSLFPESEAAPAEELYELIVSGRERAGGASVESFTDIMTVGSPQQKQAVIALVARHFRPMFTPALKLGLADADPSVRVQAATATARVEHEFNERWLKLDRLVQADPGDTVTRYNLARHLDEYAFCGLLDSNRERELRREALAHYEACLAASPDHVAARNDCGRLMLRVGKVEAAAAVMEPAVATTEDRRLLAWYAESLFRLRRFDDLRALCVRRGDLLLGQTSLFDTLTDVVSLWVVDLTENGVGTEDAEPAGEGAA